MTSKDIRKNFLNFFKNKNHKIVPSAPMVIKNDPTLMFTNAGMNQFKEYFLGNTAPKFQRAADTQKCLRVSGKHNDLEEVGKDTYHHTMFEMLGNWSFGKPGGKDGYFKKEAIAWAWEFLTEVCGINKDALYVSVFKGSDDKDNLELDKEAYDYWKDIVPVNRIILGDKKDNFWEMGEQGPCGPCSEIHVDIRPKSERSKVDGASLVNMDHPLVVEIWNLVFIQYNRKANGTLEPLPSKHIDTGMGFERLCMVLQGVNSNYDTDVFTPLIKDVERIAKISYGKNDQKDIATRVIVDHIRAVAFSIADGQLPSNTGAGYVIRRILRRAVRYGYSFLDIKKPFMYELIGTLAETMGSTFPELDKQKQLIQTVIKEEEQSFLNTLEQGLILLDAVISKTKGNKIEGKKAFELYDTYGFPIDLTALIAEEKGLKVDHKGFAEAMERQKERSKVSSEIKKEDWIVLLNDPVEEFVGYDILEADVKIVKYRKITSKQDGTNYQLVFNLTPFYPEGGGQVGDKGRLLGSNEESVDIYDTKKVNNEIIHFVRKLPQDPSENFIAEVDKKNRKLTARNHTATHLLHQALREILGTHVEQKGSAINFKYLRFDFSHFSKLTSEELKAVENFVNQKIEDHIALEENRSVPMKKALEEGAMALFGEKYGDVVRTIRFAESIELCGGTHVHNTADIWHFKITSESAIAAGIRRIEAVTSEAVKELYAASDMGLEKIKELLKVNNNPVEAVASLQQENNKLKKDIEQLYKEKATSIALALESELETIHGIRFLAKRVSLDGSGLKEVSFGLGKGKSNLFLLLGSEHQGKALLSCFISKELAKSKNLNAGTIVRDLGKYIKGGGGGQPFFATAGGKDPSGIPEALRKAKEYLE